MISYSKKIRKGRRAQVSNKPALTRRETFSLVLAKYAANAGRLRRRILRILSPLSQARDSV